MTVIPYILARRTIKVPVEGVDGAGTVAERNNKQEIRKNYTLFSNSVMEINNPQVDNVKGLDIAMPIYNLIEYNKDYGKKEEFYGNIVEMK